MANSRDSVTVDSSDFGLHEKVRTHDQTRSFPGRKTEEEQHKLGDG